MDYAQPSLKLNLVLDTRSQTEYAVSHIETAVCIDPLIEDLTAISTVSQDRLIVVYCAVDYRRAKLAQQLDKAGMKCIYNLSGGIFQWVLTRKSLRTVQGEKLCLDAVNFLSWVAGVGSLRFAMGCDFIFRL
ncbi:rhodanese-like domain-containing protein [Nostoc sp.]|uniref:rhodanese-like domain-containing protein n=1 Tax=Nostoc sp. TaxID=1180 RepID=UPI002FFB9AFC